MSITSHAHAAPTSPHTLISLVVCVWLVSVLITIPQVDASDTPRESAMKIVDLEGDVWVNETMYVPSDTLLRVHPGTRVYLGSMCSIRVYGHIEAVGSPTEQILFTSGGEREKGQWGSVGLYNNTGGDVVSYCIFSYSHQGLLLSGASGVGVDHCTFISNDQGVTFYDSAQSSVKASGFVNNSCAVEFEMTAFNLLDNCVMEGNNYGLVLKRASTDNEMYNCTIRDTVFYPIFIQEDDSGGNRFINNDLINNTHEVVDSSGNMFDHVSRGGNYWDTYHGRDDGGSNGLAYDGVGDTDLPVCRDHYPYMLPHGWMRPPCQYFDQDRVVFSSGTFTIGWKSGKSAPFCPPQWDYSLDISSDPGFDTRTSFTCSEPFRDLMGMSPGTYYARAWAMAGGLRSPAGSVLEIRVVDSPLSPVNISCRSVPQGGALSLDWTGPDQDDVLAYHVRSNMSGSWGQVSTIPGEEHGCTIDMLENGRMYFFRLTTEDTTGTISEPSPVIEGVPEDSIPPAAPGDLNTSVTPDGIYVTWSRVTDVDLYVVRRGTGGPSSLENVTSTGYTSYMDRNVSRGCVYYYRVVSLKANGLEGRSGIVSVAMDPPPEILLNTSFSKIMMTEDEPFILDLTRVFKCSEALHYDASTEGLGFTLEWLSPSTIRLTVGENVSDVRFSLELMAYSEGASRALTSDVYVMNRQDPPRITGMVVTRLADTAIFSVSVTVVDPDRDQELLYLWSLDGRSLGESGPGIVLDLGSDNSSIANVSVRVIDPDLLEDFRNCTIVLGHGNGTGDGPVEGTPAVPSGDTDRTGTGRPWARLLLVGVLVGGLLTLIAMVVSRRYRKRS